MIQHKFEIPAENTEMERVAQCNAELLKALAAKERILNDLIERIYREESEATTDVVNSGLQRVVESRTLELEQRNKELEDAQATLNAAQAELYHAQKLEAIGRLAAGVSHEINTPIQFVGDNIHFLGEGFTDLFAYVSAVDALVAELNLRDEVKAKLEALKDQFDLSYLAENLPKAIERSANGVARVAEIVQSMKSFSHPDRSTMRAVDLNASIRTTLSIAKNEYKYVAEVQTEFGELPHVECLGGEVNQVFLNLIVNAAHAIEEANRGTSDIGKITIRTKRQDDFVIVEISDSGCGIPLNIQESVFEQFFTTKEVGKGTGQGLAIAQQVICQKHSGEIWFDTMPGQGTTFFIKLPIRQAAPVTVENDLAA